MLVPTDWLASRLDDPAIVVVDMRWRESGSGRQVYERGHIPGARYLDWSTDLVDPDAPVAFTLAPPERFAAAMAGCGIGDETTVVAYADGMGNGPFRLWWASRVYGHDDVEVLDGGFDRWVGQGLPVSTDPAHRRSAPSRPWTPRHAARPRSRPGRRFCRYSIAGSERYLRRITRNTCCPTRNSFSIVSETSTFP